MAADLGWAVTNSCEIFNPFLKIKKSYNKSYKFYKKNLQTAAKFQPISAIKNLKTNLTKFSNFQTFKKLSNSGEIFNPFLKIKKNLTTNLTRKNDAIYVHTVKN